MTVRAPAKQDVVGVGDTIACQVTHPSQKTLAVRLDTPASVAYANSVLRQNRGWSVIKRAERRACCETAVGQPHRVDCREHPLGRHCQNGGDVCLAGNADGVCCPEDSCDIDDGSRQLGEQG
jgi:hypothetical protein